MLIEKLKSEIAACGSDAKRKISLTTLLGELERSKGICEINDALLEKTVSQLRNGIFKSIREQEKVGIKNIDRTDFDYMLAIYEEFVPMPKTLDEAETTELIKSIISGGANNIGAIMKALRGSGELIDNRMASGIAQGLLSD